MSMIEGPAIPEAPTRLDPSTFPEEKRALYQGVRAALSALPAYFDFDNPVGGIDATDLHNLNTLMGAAIEVQVVEALNGLRTVWDPDRLWSEYSFARSAQAFPDVRLVRRTDAGVEVTGVEVIFGIELKGRFLLTKEGVPSLRYRVAPEACSPWDLLCVVPWYLSNAVAGKPQVGAPWVEQARYAAQWRDHWWRYVRRTKDVGDLRCLEYPEGAAPYPNKADLVGVVARKDGGDNFGRLPRCKPLMDTFVADSLDQPVLGIPAKHWQIFLKAHADTADSDEVLSAILAMDFSDPDFAERVDRLRGLLRSIAVEFDFS
jgi:hypothetical protein